MSVAFIEPIAGVIRVFDDESKSPPDPYDFCCTLRWIGKEEVELLGITKPPTREQDRAMRELLRQSGVKWSRYSRIRNGEPHIVRRRLSRE